MDEKNWTPRNSGIHIAPILTTCVAVQSELPPPQKNVAEIEGFLVVGDGRLIVSVSVQGAAGYRSSQFLGLR